MYFIKLFKTWGSPFGALGSFPQVLVLDSLLGPARTMWGLTLEVVTWGA
jgi:hypothetical protein